MMRKSQTALETRNDTKAEKEPGIFYRFFFFQYTEPAECEGVSPAAVSDAL